MPTRYGEAKTPVTEDVLQIGLIFAFAIIAVSFIIILPGIRGTEVSGHDAINLGDLQEGL
jgi:dual oxidase maturation factor 2/dual oxidase maturation factor 1